MLSSVRSCDIEKVSTYATVDTFKNWWRDRDILVWQNYVKIVLPFGQRVCIKSKKHCIGHSIDLTKSWYHNFLSVCTLSIWYVWKIGKLCLALHLPLIGCVLNPPVVMWWIHTVMNVQSLFWHMSCSVWNTPRLENSENNSIPEG